MSYTKITLRYAAAYFDLAEEKGIVENAHEDMTLLGKVCTTNRDFVLMLQNPVINAEKKRKVIAAIFGSSIHQISLSFMGLMIRKRRERYLPAIAEAFNDLYKASMGIKTAYVTSAVGLASNEKAGVLEILKKLTDKNIDLVEITDKTLLGGFVLNLDDFQIDQSISTKIKALRKDFEKNLFIKGF
ncbi:MAG: ATP synthase F1 subunit delta [Lentimicrobiaceae bacterium]|jgi:F-type H+-transporting ATPase subunit delta